MIGIIATLFENGSYFSQSLATSFSYHGGSQSRLKSAHAARILGRNNIFLTGTVDIENATLRIFSRYSCEADFGDGNS